MNDLARAARLVRVAERPDIAASELKTCIGLGIRYALISSTLNRLAQNMSPVLIVALVQQRNWPLSQALAYSRILPPASTVQALTGISSNLNLQEKEALLREALAVARAIGHEWARAFALADLGQVDEALETARAIGDETARDHALRDLAPRLAAAGRLDEALVAARAIGDEGARAFALADLGQVDEALETARAIGDEGARDCALRDLVPRLAAAGRLDEALETARAIGNETARAFALRPGWPRPDGSTRPSRRPGRSETRGPAPRPGGPGPGG